MAQTQNNFFSSRKGSRFPIKAKKINMTGLLSPSNNTTASTFDMKRNTYNHGSPAN